MTPASMVTRPRCLKPKTGKLLQPHCSVQLCTQMVPYKIVRANNGDAWVEVWPN